ncbi:hypothetical protein BD310DRAFT_917858 [Dichomitus squalens]|uniref:Uncharacterized protein n=1 Tax=Dichomitus squalens TaxID=114155 RepID=A0A4Q9Q5E6_9APHY|nr:hypothetical protein BD310DRAFT_917858 [Dichomitus squalens]
MYNTCTHRRMEIHMGQGKDLVLPRAAHGYARILSRYPGQKGLLLGPHRRMGGSQSLSSLSWTSVLLCTCASSLPSSSGRLVPASYSIQAY